LSDKILDVGIALDGISAGLIPAGPRGGEIPITFLIIFGGREDLRTTNLGFILAIDEVVVFVVALFRNIECDEFAGLISLRQFSTFFRLPGLTMFDVVVTNADFVANCPEIMLALLLTLFALFIVMTLRLEVLEIDTGFSLQSLFCALLEDGRLKRQLLNEDGRFPRRCMIEGENVDIDEDWIFVDSNGISCELVTTGPFCIARKCDFA